jgi:large subunit ribosomal protein LP0
MAGKGRKQLSKEEKQKLKEQYIETFINMLDKYSKIIFVEANNVRSKQMAEIRMGLRSKGELLMGKNTLMKKAIKVLLEDKDGKYKSLASKATDLAKLPVLLKGNVGLVFTNGDLNEVKDVIMAYKVGAPAKQGAISPVTVVIQPGNTGLEPTKTSFFQALNINTKITKGTVEIIKEHLLLAPGDKVGSSEAALLQMLNIKPFEYGLVMVNIYDQGAVYSPAVLSLTDEVMEQKVREAANNVASLGLALDIPNEASIPHSIANIFKNLLAVAASTQFSFKQAEKVKEFLLDPSKFASATPVAVVAAATVVEPVKAESESEDDGDAFGGLF